MYRLRIINSQPIHVSKFSGGAGRGGAGGFLKVKKMYRLIIMNSQPVNFQLVGRGEVGRGGWGGGAGQGGVGWPVHFLEHLKNCTG